MSAIPFTIFFSLLLAAVFAGLFVFERRAGRVISAERDSLLPLADERPAPAGRSTDAGHQPAGRGACGCRKGVRAACPTCLRLRDEQDPAYF
jgi:hypothetical protein